MSKVPPLESKSSIWDSIAGGPSSAAGHHGPHHPDQIEGDDCCGQCCLDILMDIYEGIWAFLFSAWNKLTSLCDGFGHAHAAQVDDPTWPQARQPLPIIFAAGRFGAQAFEPLNTYSAVSPPAIPEATLSRIFASDRAFQKHSEAPSTSHMTVEQLLRSSLKNGTPKFPGEETINELRVIFGALDNPKVPKAQKITIVDQLCRGFSGCQDEQKRVCQSLAAMVLNRGDFVGAVKNFWHDYKMRKLEVFIGERHPGAQTASSIMPSSQFPHIRSRYVVELGQACGFDTRAARQDQNMPWAATVFGLRSRQSTVALFQAQLDLNEFMRELVADINNPSQEHSFIDKELVYKWADKNLPGFGFFKDDEDYRGMRKPTSEQEYQQKPFISWGQAESMMKLVGIAAE